VLATVPDAKKSSYLIFNAFNVGSSNRPVTVSFSTGLEPANRFPRSWPDKPIDWTVMRIPLQT
jgi:hypothetical protein